EASNISAFALNGFDQALRLHHLQNHSGLRCPARKRLHYFFRGDDLHDIGIFNHQHRICRIFTRHNPLILPPMQQFYQCILFVNRRIFGWNRRTYSRSFANSLESVKRTFISELESQSEK
ncbi:hypothetical protein, partial [uncultured Acetatifactor sp.]|uniref:hypothetical protein n=1 Tax=uncultured Acetatifactor sp. TaxID=1671927 RepID=UPI00261F5158